MSTHVSCVHDQNVTQTDEQAIANTDLSFVDDASSARPFHITTAMGDSAIETSRGDVGSDDVPETILCGKTLQIRLLSRLTVRGGLCCHGNKKERGDEAGGMEEK